jgi:hypothetical protein
VARDGGLVALFARENDLMAALRRLKTERLTVKTIFSPIPLPDIQEIVERGPSAVRFIVLVGALLGGASLVGMAVYAHLSYNLVTGGKPVLPWIAWVIVCFEGMVLGGVAAATLAWIILGRLPSLHRPSGYDGVFAQDRFGVLVECGVADEATVKRLLEEEGAEEVRRAS